MQAILVISTVMQVVGSISAGYQQANALNQQADMYMKQAQIYGAQIQTDDAENDRRLAVEKAATAAESLERTNRLRRIVGATVAAGASAGIGTQYGSITSLNEYNMGQAGAEDYIAAQNSKQRIASLNLNSAVNAQNLANSAVGATFQAGQLRDQGSQAIAGGYMKAIGSLTDYGMSQANRGSIPVAAPTGKNGTFLPASYGPQQQIKWS